MFFIQWEELCVARGLLVHRTVQRVVTEGVYQHKACFLESVLKIRRKFDHSCGLYQASRHEYSHRCVLQVTFSTLQ